MEAIEFIIRPSNIFSQHTRFVSLSYTNRIKRCQLASKITTSCNSFREFRKDFASFSRMCFGKRYNTVQWKGNILFYSVKNKIHVADLYGYSLARSSFSGKCVNRRDKNSRRIEVLILSSRIQSERYFILLKILNCESDQPKTIAHWG